MTSITNRFSSNGKQSEQSASRPVLPTPRTQASGGRPNIPNFPVHVSKPTKPEVTNQNVIEKSRFPNFPTANLNTQSNFQNAFKQNTVVQPKGPNPLRQNTVVLPNIPNFPTATRRQQQLLSNRIVNPKGVLVNLNSPPKTSVASVPTAQNANSITKATQTLGVSSLETVKEGLNVANQIASQISEDSIRKKFIDFFIQNTKNKKSTIKNSAPATNNVVSNNNQLPIVSPAVSSAANFNPLAQIANFMKNARSNSTEDAPMTFFIGPLLVPAHVLENAREDPSGRTVNSPLIALPFGPTSENSQSSAATSANLNSVRPRTSATSRVAPIVTSATSANRRAQTALVAQTHQPIVRPAINNINQLRPAQRSVAPFRRVSDIQNILDASQSVEPSRTVLNRQRPQPVVRNTNIRNNINAVNNNNRITVTRTRIRQPVVQRRVVNINRSLVPVSVAQQTIQAVRRRNELSRQSSIRSRIPRPETSIHISTNPPSLQQNNVDLSLSPQTSVLIQQTPVVTAVQTQVTSGVNTQGSGSVTRSENNQLPTELSQFFMDPTTISAAELAQLSQQTNQNQMLFPGANPFGLQQPFQPFQQPNFNALEFPFQQTTQNQFQGANGQQTNMLQQQFNMFPGSPFQPPMFNNFQGPMPPWLG